MWSYVSSKVNKVWIWLAIDTLTREIVGVYVGERTRAAARQLWQSLPAVYRQCAVCYTDNASFHKRGDILSRLSKQVTNFRLDFLPAYSPDYNIIELVWHSCKEYIAHRLFRSVDELKVLLDRLLNQGELVIKWQRKLKNKGNHHHIAA